MPSWWVNQNKTYDYEVAEGFLWSPKTNKNGSKNHFYENMTLVKPTDVVFSFCDTRIRAVGVAIGPAETADRPNFGTTGESWAQEGWRVPVEFVEIGIKVRPKDFIEELRPHLAKKYAPLQANGDGNQGAYLVSLSDGLAEILLAKIGKPAAFFISAIAFAQGKDDDEAQKAIEGRTDIGPTQKKQLIQARRGQGIFKSNVRLNESKCRVTGVTDLRLLIASHIKPWAESSDQEKLDGCNGLLLSPHVDRLFDRGFITFSNEGTLLVSPKLDPAVMQQWGIKTENNLGSFNGKQCTYLEFHRTEKFKK